MNWLILALAACPPSANRQAVDLVAQGRTIEATDVWIDALGQDLDNPIARKHTIDAATAAWQSKLADAARMEQNGAPDDAIPLYDELIALAKRLHDVEIDTFDVAAVERKRAAAVDGAALRWRGAGDALEVVGRHADAIQSYEKSRTFKADDPATIRAEADAWRAQAELELTANHYAKASEAFDTALGLVSDPEIARRAAALHRAWGHWALSMKQCRVAADHLAKAVPFDAAAIEDLDAARSCARVEILVEPFEDATSAQVAGTAVGPVLSDAIEAQIRSKGSSYLRLLDPTNPPAPDPKVLRWAVRGRVTQLRVERPEPTTTTETVDATTLIPCDSKSAVFDDDMGWMCPSPVSLRYEAHQRPIVVHLGATIRVADALSGEQAHAKTLDRDDSRTVAWTDGWRLADGDTPAIIAVKPGFEQYQLPADLAALPHVEPPSPSDPALVADALKALAAEAGADVLASIDATTAGPEPAFLDLGAP
jgi:tetratricopeptide (TPR) repeat protein